jgi:hypothetical protein
MEFIHMRTAYILRWNKRDYKEIIGVFGLEEHLEQFKTAHFSPSELASDDIIVERGRYYEPRVRGVNVS